MDKLLDTSNKSTIFTETENVDSSDDNNQSNGKWTIFVEKEPLIFTHTGIFKILNDLENLIHKTLNDI